MNKQYELLSCDGCGLPLDNAFRVIPKNLSQLGRTTVLHHFPFYGESCKLRFCSRCGTNVNTIVRTCQSNLYGQKCGTVLSPEDKVCPKCFSRSDIEIKSFCQSCGIENKQELRQKI